MPFVSRTLQYSFCACVQNILKIVMFVFEKMKRVSLILFLDAFPLDPRCPLDNRTSLHIYVLGLGGKGAVLGKNPSII